jgi:hypothetical protein
MLLVILITGRVWVSEACPSKWLIEKGLVSRYVAQYGFCETRVPRKLSDVTDAEGGRRHVVTVCREGEATKATKQRREGSGLN